MVFPQPFMTHPHSATQHRQKGLCLLWWLGASYQRLPQARDHQTEDHLGHEGRAELGGVLRSRFTTTLLDAWGNRKEGFLF